MGIYKNSIRLDHVYQGDKQIETINHDHKMVFKKPQDSDNRTYIEFIVDFSDGNFMVPMSAFSADGLSFEIEVFLDHVFYGRFTSTVSITNGSGIPVTGPARPEATIRFQPVGTPTVGWGEPFGYYDNTVGCNDPVNKKNYCALYTIPTGLICN